MPKVLPAGDFDIYTDGSCIQDKGFGSWAFVVLHQNTTVLEVSGFEPETTCYRAEFQAPIEALRIIPIGSSIRLFTDSRIVVDTMTLWVPEWKALGWVKKNGRPIPGVDLIRILDELCSTRTVEWKWVKAHAGHVYNERCDQLCLEARERRQGSIC